jgi:hypothetical protein
MVWYGCKGRMLLIMKPRTRHFALAGEGLKRHVESKRHASTSSMRKQSPDSSQNLHLGDGAEPKSLFFIRGRKLDDKYGKDLDTAFHRLRKYGYFYRFDPNDQAQ